MRTVLQRLVLSASLGLFLTTAATAQWKPVASPTKADLLSVDVRDGAAWAGGQQGTVIHSGDGGATWQACKSFPHGDRIAISGIAAIDSTTAVAISSGKGQASKVYRTNDACNTWQVTFENPEESSEFDILRRVAGQQLYLLSEPVSGKFIMYFSKDGGSTWFVTDDAGLDAIPGETASGSSLVTSGPFLFFGTKDALHPRLRFTQAKCPPGQQVESCPIVWTSSRLPTPPGLLKALATRTVAGPSGKLAVVVLGIAVAADGTMSSISNDGGMQWSIATSFPLAEPAAVSFFGMKQLWIAVGEDGTALGDSSGKRWAKAHEAGSPTDSGWSAMALPIAVGKGGRIGLFEPDTLK